MAQTSLSIGMTHTLVQSRSYALPAKLLFINSSAAVDVSMDETAWSVLTNANTTGAQTGARFIRSGGVNTLVTCKDAGTQAGNFSSGAMVVQDYVAVGTNPAQSEAVRLANNAAISWRNNVGNADYTNVKLDTANNFYLGGAAVKTYMGSSIEVVGAATLSIGTNPAQSGAVRLANNQEIKGRNAANSADISIARVATNDRLELGIGTAEITLGGTAGLIYGSMYMALTERAAPGPVANQARMWCQDNGSGKTQLMVQFGTGVAIQLAIEP